MNRLNGFPEEQNSIPKDMYVNLYSEDRVMIAGLPYTTLKACREQRHTGPGLIMKISRDINGDFTTTTEEPYP